jgi:hypothetical protein
MRKLVLVIAAFGFGYGFGTVVFAENVPIAGNVESRCLITTSNAGVYGNPLPQKLSTAVADGGVLPIVRYDISLAGAYKAKVTTPTSFSSSPALSDSVAWTGSTILGTTSDAGMSGYEAAKVVYDASTEFDLTVAGSTWFKSTSTATYGYDKSFPGGTYTAVVVAECIAK